MVLLGHQVLRARESSLNSNLDGVSHQGLERLLREIDSVAELCVPGVGGGDPVVGELDLGRDRGVVLLLMEYETKRRRRGRSALARTGVKQYQHKGQGRTTMAMVSASMSLS